MTQKELANVIRQHENKDGSPSQFSLPRGATVYIESELIRGTGPHRAWKYLYFLKLEGQRRMGGYDRRDSFVAWAVGQLPPKVKQIIQAQNDKCMHDLPAGGHCQECEEGVYGREASPVQDVDRWIADLNAAGWKRHATQSTIWVSPWGAWYRGPFKAWCVMKGVPCQP